MLACHDRVQLILHLFHIADEYIFSHCLNSLRCINVYLAMDCGEHNIIRVDGLHAVIMAWMEVRLMSELTHLLRGKVHVTLTCVTSYNVIISAV